MNFVLLEPKNRENLATIIRSGQNFGVKSVFVIGGFIRDKYKGNIHKFNHQMNTQDGISTVTLMYFESLSLFLKHLPAQTTLVIIETVEKAVELKEFKHPKNATYMLGSEAKGFTKHDLIEIESYFKSLTKGIPEAFISQNSKTAHLAYVKINTPQSLNLGVCGSIVMYDRNNKLTRPMDI